MRLCFRRNVAATLAWAALLMLSALPAGAAAPDDHWTSGFHAPGMDGKVRTAVMFQGELIVGGTFEHMGRERMHHLAAWNGERWRPVGDGLNGAVSYLLVHEGQLYAAGSFGRPGEESINGVARFDGAAWTFLADDLPYTVNRLALFQGALVAGLGPRDSGPVSSIYRWTEAGWTSMGDTCAYSETEYRVVLSLAALGDTLFASTREMPGTYSNLDPSPLLSVFERGRWYPLLDWLRGPQSYWTNSASDIEILDGSLYAAGVFSHDVSGIAAIVARWNGHSFERVGDEFLQPPEALGTWLGRICVSSYDRIYIRNGNQWEAIPDSHQADVLVDSPWGLLAAGGFTRFGETAANGIAIYDGHEWRGLGPQDGLGFDERVTTVTAQGETIVVGGTFRHAGRTPANGVVQGDGTGWSAMPYVTQNLECSITIEGRPFLAGYSYDPWELRTEPRIVSWSGTGWIAEPFLPTRVLALTWYKGNLVAGGIPVHTDWDPGPFIGIPGADWGSPPYDLRGAVEALAADSSDLFAGGRFTTSGRSVPLRHVGRWDGSAWSAMGDGLEHPVRALTLLGSRLYAASSPDDGSAAGHVLVWQGHTWTPVGSSFRGHIKRLCAYHGRLVAAGSFEMLDDPAVRYLARWDGAAWKAFGSGPSAPVAEVSVTGDKLWIGGAFLEAGGQASARIALWRESLAAVDSITAEQEGGRITIRWTNPRDAEFQATVLRMSTTTAILSSPEAGDPVPNGADGVFPGSPGSPGSFTFQVPEDGRTVHLAAFAVLAVGYSDAHPLVVKIEDRTPPELGFAFEGDSTRVDRVVLRLHANEPISHAEVLVGGIRVPTDWADEDPLTWESRFDVRIGTAVFDVTGAVADTAGNEAPFYARLGVLDVHPSPEPIESSIDRFRLDMPPRVTSDAFLLLFLPEDPYPGAVARCRLLPEVYFDQPATLSYRYDPAVIAPSDANRWVVTGPDGVRIAAHVDPAAHLVLWSIVSGGTYTLSLGEPGASTPVDGVWMEQLPSPNPFSAAMSVRLGLIEPQGIRAEIFDISGRRIRALLDARLSPGPHGILWDGRDDTGRPAASGVYLLRLEGARFGRTDRVVRLR